MNAQQHLLFNLDGQVAVVTGALGRLGPVWIEALLAAGARVAALDLPSAKLSDGYATLQAQYGEDQLRFYYADVRDRVQLEAARNRCTNELGTASILVNNAGLDQPPGPVTTYRIEDIPARQFSDVFDVNVSGAYQTTQVFGEAMCETGGGSVINIGSLYASVSPDARFYEHLDSEPPFLKPPAYGASKAALVNLTRYLATHWAQYGVRVNALSPGGEPQAAAGDENFVKHSPSDGRAQYHVSRSGGADVAAAVAAARRAQPEWGAMPPVRRGAILHELAIALRTQREQIAYCVHVETGKSMKDARGEAGAAGARGRFMAGEGQRLYGRTTTSAVPNKYASTVREPLGVAGLIIAANTPIANVAWKVFPALICGNAAVLKAAVDTPLPAYLFAELARTAGLPAGVLNVIQGYGAEAGEPLVLHPDVAVLSFTGSTAVGRSIAELAGKRLAKVSLELGGKNPLVVCDDADLDLAVKWTVLSAFSNAGQRCAAASRVIVFDAIYAAFREKHLAAVAEERVGTAGAAA